MTTPTAKFPTILTEVTIDHGPEELLAPLFLRLEHAVRQLGLRLSFGSLTSLSAINAANRASWMPLFPVYRPDYWPHTPSDAFVLLASEPDGRPIATLAVSCRWRMRSSRRRARRSWPRFRPSARRRGTPSATSSPSTAA